MSLRKDLRDGLIAAIKTRNLVAASAVLPWQGDIEEFNSSGVFPSIEVGTLVRLPSVVYGPNTEVGVATKKRQFRWSVYVSTEDTDIANADEAAWEILEDLETNLPGTAITVSGKKYYLYLVPGVDGAETMLVRHSGKALYVQQYYCEDLESH